MADDTAAKEVSAGEVLNNHGGVRDNDLLQQLIDDPDSDEIEVVSHSPYLCPSSLPSKLRNTETSIVILSLNAQSLLAKFNSFRVFTWSTKIKKYLLSCNLYPRIMDIRWLQATLSKTWRLWSISRKCNIQHPRRSYNIYWFWLPGYN